MRQKNRFLVSIIISVLAVQFSYGGYSAQYKIALQDLIKVHKKYFPHEPIVMNNSSLVYSVYRKIIAPWAFYINGMAHIVENKFQSKEPYWKSMQSIWNSFQSSQNEVKQLKTLFSGVDEAALLASFYEEIGSDVVQIFFNIIQDCTNALSTDQQDLEGCFIAYQIAYQMYQSDMQIINIQQGSDFESSIAGNMIILYQNAIKNLLNKLSVGMLGATDIEDIYDQVARYYNYLAIVATDINDTQLISSSQTQANQVCQNYGYYLQAQKLYQQAVSLLKKNKNSVSLDVKNPAQVIALLSSMSKNVGQIIQLAQQANQYYAQAQDIFGANQAQLLHNLVNNVDLWVVQGLAQLWILYLQDQSAQNQYTAPTIAHFISSRNQNSQNPVTNDQVIAAFENLSALIQQKSNPVNALATLDVLKEYSLMQIIDSLQQEIITFVQSGVKSSSWMYTFTSLQAINSAYDILFYLGYLSESVVSAFTQGSGDYALQAMAYAQALDSIYKQLPPSIRIQVNSLIPYFPLQIQQRKSILQNTAVATWYDWTGQILLASLTVNREDLQSNKIAQITIQKPTSIEKKPQKKNISNLMNLAHQNALNENFAQASSQYQQLMNMYTTLYSINPNDPSLYANMMESKTMYTALSFASTVQASGNQVWGDIKNIPTEYSATRYGFNTISVTELGLSEFPASLISFQAGKEYTTFTLQQQKDILQIIKAHIVNQLLVQQGIGFTDVFVDYTLEFNSQVDQSGRALATQLEAQVDISFNKFDGVEIISIMLSDASTIESVVCKNLPLRNVDPLISSMATALTFYASTQILVQPGKHEVRIGNASYRSGNDEKLSRIFLDKIIKVYLAAAYPHWQQAESLMTHLTHLLQSTQNKSVKSYPLNFANNLKMIDSYVTRAQALLYAQSDSAYTFSLKANNKNVAQRVESLFFGMYKKYIAWMKECLVGKNPFDSTYQIVLHKINTTYVSWAALLQAQEKISEVEAINNDIISLFTTAGKGCIDISYTEPLYPDFIQYHYATAAHYFLAVQTQYYKMKEFGNAQSINSLINDAYFKGSSQNVDLFLHVQKHGVAIEHEESKEKENVPFSQLVSQKVFASTAKQNAYNSVQNLLLNAGIGFSFLIKRIQGAVVQNSASKKSITQKGISSFSKNVTNFLRDQNIMSSSDVQPAYFKEGVAQSIFSVNMQAYNQFKNNMNDYSSWLSVLYSALQALYGFSYLGAKTDETGKEMENQMTEFFTELEKHTSSLENPSSVYVG
ncbi:hypothetical protein HYV10_03855 [Candidatus Dependentiae bacterium]|nr:hypothetical protein [Candidatus Dependentiae bacterium]